MRRTKQSSRRYLKELTGYIDRRLAKTNSDNIALYLPGLTDVDIELLRLHFQTVKRGFLGYVEFKIGVLTRPACQVLIDSPGGLEKSGAESSRASLNESSVGSAERQSSAPLDIALMR